MKKLIQITCLLVIQINLFGQIHSIDSVYIFPENPIIGDTVLLIGQIRTASAGCSLSYTLLNIDEENKIIEIENCYSVGPLDTICPSIDTLLIGQLQEGDYQIVFKAKGFETAINPNGDCSNSVNETIKEVDFIVGGTNSTNNKDEQLYQFSLIENPVREFAIFKITQSESRTEIVIADNLGRTVVKQKIANNYEGEIRIDIKQLPNGIYYCYLINTKNSKSKTIKMIKE